MIYSPQLIAIFLFMAGNLFATSITGGGETVETTPTERPIVVKPDDLPDSTPAPTTETSTPAESTTQEVVEKKPPQTDDYKAALKAAQIAYSKKEYDTALENVRKAEVLKPDQPEIINFRGAIYAETGRYVEAIQLYEKSLILEPKSFWPGFNIAEVDFIQKKYPEAREKLQQLLGKFPENELVRLKLMLTYLMEKNDAAAKAELDKFPFPANTAAREFAMASWEFAHGNHDEAMKWVQSGEYIFGYARTDFLYQTLADLKWLPLPRPTPVVRK